MFDRILSCIAPLIAALACVSSHAGQRAFVSSTGSDANLAGGCNLTTPCRTFQTAHTAVDAGGEIVALDTAGYAPVTITKSVSIIGSPGFVAGIAVGSGNGVTIATAGVNVVLRNLYINGIGGSNGVHMTAGDSLSIENCVVSRMTHGIRVDSAADVRIVNTLVRANSANGAQIGGNATVNIAKSQFLGNALNGILVQSSTAGTTGVAINDTVISGNGFGLRASASGAGTFVKVAAIRSTVSNNTDAGVHNQADLSGNALTTIGSSIVSGNATGLSNPASAATVTLESLGNNIVRQNVTPTAGVITQVAGS